MLAVKFQFSPGVADQKQEQETQWEEGDVGSNQRPWSIDADQRSVRLDSLTTSPCPVHPLPSSSKATSRAGLCCAAPLGCVEAEDVRGRQSAWALKPEFTASESDQEQSDVPMTHSPKLVGQAPDAARSGNSWRML